MAELLEQADDPTLRLRIFARGGGCGGLDYGFSFDDAADVNDIQIQPNGITLLVDPMSYHNLMGATIDHQGGPDGSFIIDNPSADCGSCDCGSV